ncbi:hypothetical protein AKJ41_03340 [candidate division MSBL1 archaeon SCGC-AAA259O05]|uniref:Uncharacterized protein n=1 Tax=candidate division MSBL1 archaeon SCGC-AAA259O05 TaxID=1698271 RepID=A0A133V3G9_9EURY|nr:hypothetical protein AKJ41_03340 [candidate division MSBL1 archaeon SCGC-AAA259O05]
MALLIGDFMYIKRFLVRGKTYFVVTVLGLLALQLWHWLYSTGTLGLHPAVYILGIVILFSALGYPGGKLVEIWREVSKNGRED